MHNKRLHSIYHFIDNLNIRNIVNYNKNICLIYRNYKSSINKKKLIKFKNTCRKFGVKFIISNNLKLAFKLRVDGAYIPSFNKELNHKKFEDFQNFLLIGSAHSIREIRDKEKQKVEQIFLSPLFKNKKTNKTLNVLKFNNLTKFTKKPIIALGGINRNNIKKLKLINVDGFAGIRYFENNKNVKKS